MKRTWHMAIAVGALAASVIPTAALEDARGPLSPSGGQSEANSIAPSSGAQEADRQMVISAAPGEFLFIPEFAAPDENVRGPLSPSGGVGDETSNAVSSGR